MRAWILWVAATACGRPANHDVDGGIDFNMPDATIDARNMCPNSTGVLLDTRVDFMTGMTPFNIVAADFNGDHLPDLAIATENPGGATVLFNTSPGCAATFAPGVDVQTAGGVRSVATADFNGDGKPDLAVMSRLLDRVTVLLDQTELGADVPKFAAPVDLGTASNPANIVVGDLNNDGRPDIVACAPDAVSVLLDATEPMAAAPRFEDKLDLPHTGSTFGVAVADFNSDGKLDIVVTDSVANTVSVYLNTTRGLVAFASPVTFPTGMSPFGVAVGDLDGDEKPDLVVTDIMADQISILKNTTDKLSMTPSFAAKVDLPTGMRPYSVAIGDLNRDGKPDIIVGAEGSNGISILLATGDGYAPKLDVATLSAPHGVALADLDGDTAPDLIVSSSDSDRVSVLLAR